MRQGITNGEEDKELHPVGDHADLLEIGRKKIKDKAEKELSRDRRPEFGFDQEEDDGNIEQCRKIPELVEVTGMIEDIGVINQPPV